MASEPTLSLEVHAHDRAGSDALIQALTAALKEAGLPGSITVHSTYSQPRMEQRSGDLTRYESMIQAAVGTGGVLIVKEVIVRAVNVGGDGVYEALKRGFARWRGATGNEGANLFGPDGRTPLDEWIEEQEMRKGDDG